MTNGDRRPRSLLWANLDPNQWREFVNEDLDTNTREHARMRAEFVELLEPVIEGQKNLTKLMIGLLLSLATASVVGALNLLYAS